MSWTAKILTVSDSVSQHGIADRSGPAVRACLESAGFTVVGHLVVADGIANVASALRELTVGFSGLVVTTGGTGFAPRDVTPEGTLQVIDRLAPGIAEAARNASPKGRLTRGVAGTVGTSLIINVPGSPSGAVECLEAVLDVIPHALELLNGGHPHTHGETEGSSSS